MNNILNAQEAFAALQKGKTVLCRYAGNGNLHADKNFSTLDQMPATVFVLPNYEFCVQVEMLELAGIKFTKPLTIDEIEQGQDVFLFQPQAVILQYKYSEDIEELVDGIRSGFAQRDYDNALLQYRAFCRAVGATPLNGVELMEVATLSKRSVESTPAAIELDDILGPASGQIPEPTPVEVEEVQTPPATTEDKPKQKRLTKKEKELQGHFDLTLESIRTSITDLEVLTVVYQIESYGFNVDQLQEIERAKTEKLAELESTKAEAEIQATVLLESAEIQTDSELSVLCDAFITEIDAAVSDQDLKAIRTRINSNGDLTEVESAELETRINLKSASFEKEQSLVPFENIAAAAVAQAKKVDEETQEREWTRFHNDKPYLDLGDKSQYEIEYADLSAVVIHAQSSDEANSVVEKTHHWTTDQRNPLLSLISKRLCELQEQSNVQPKEPPSLMVQIQNAPDLTALDALEIDVSARHPDIQPRLMGYVKKRRYELEQATSAAANDEALP